MINRSNSVPGKTRSMLQQQLMDMGMSHDVFVTVTAACFGACTLLVPNIVE